ncbi:MAG TPA: AI-2E family transporter, partial [Sphingomonas sp.]|nr:AI-2E family transporter [Sphingomonas sp.]
VVVVAGLYLAREVLVPITLAVLLSFVLSPLVMLLRRMKLPKGLAILVSVLIAFGTLGGIGTIVGIQAASLVDQAPTYAGTVEKKIDGARGYVTQRLAFFTRQPDLPEGRAATMAAPSADGAFTAAVNRARAPIPVTIAENQQTPLKMASSILAPVLAPFETFVIVLVVAIFILMQKEDLRDRVIRVFGSSDLHRTTEAMDDAGNRLSRYFLSQLAVNTSFGIVIGVGMWLLGLPVPALWGILAGILRFVPYIGALLGAVMPLIVAAGVDPGWSMVIGVAVIFAVVEPLTGYVIEPLLYGHSSGLSPLSVVVAAVFWTWIWGPVGLVLSMPLTLCLVVLGRHVPALEFVDVLLGDRPALTPVEGFYQRMLADDPAEALEQAEVLLKDRSLAEYYDKVALGGLTLAAVDIRRGVVDRARAQRIVTSMLTMIDDLDSESDVASEISGTLPAAPAEWSAPATVTCIAGRGVLDDAVTAMLEQLLVKRGFGVRRIDHAAVGRDAIGRADLGSSRLICLSYLEVAGSPSHLRYLVRRLRGVVGATPIIVGMWPEGEAALSDAQIQQTLGADLYVGSLGAAVDGALGFAATPQSKEAA